MGAADHRRENDLQNKANAYPTEELVDLSDFFKTLGDLTRIRILLLLLESEVCVGDLADVLHITDSAVSHQLQILRNSRLIKKRRRGKQVFYSLADDHVQTVIGQGLEHIREGSTVFYKKQGNAYCSSLEKAV